MTYQGFKGFLDDLCKKIDVKNTAMVLHFRITSKGTTCAEQCHPFPVSSKNTWDNVKTLNGSASVTVAHNGTMSGLTLKTGFNDTQTFTVNFLTHLMQMNSQFYRTAGGMELIEQIIGTYNKLAFLTKENQIFMLGNFVEDKGIFYSNSGYLNSYKFGGRTSAYYDESYYDSYVGRGYKTVQITDFSRYVDSALLKKLEAEIEAYKKNAKLVVNIHLVSEVEERAYAELFKNKADAIMADKLLSDFYLAEYGLVDIK
jgi:predicted glutamine amidotransferase